MSLLLTCHLSAKVTTRLSPLLTPQLAPLLCMLFPHPEPSCWTAASWVPGGVNELQRDRMDAGITPLLFAMPLRLLWLSGLPGHAKNCCCCQWSEAFLMSHFWESLHTAPAFQGGVGCDGCWSLAPHRLLPGYTALRDSRGCAWVVK